MGCCCGVFLCGGKAFLFKGGKNFYFGGSFGSGVPYTSPSLYILIAVLLSTFDSGASGVFYNFHESYVGGAVPELPIAVFYFLIFLKS